MSNDFFSYLELCIHENKLPHALLIETNEVKQLIEELTNFFYKQKLIKNRELINNSNVVCLKSENRVIKSAAIDYLQMRFSTKPIYDKYNLYIIEECDELNISASNKLLKFLEEPSGSIIGFLISKPNASILPTIKSRCQHFRVLYEEEAINSENLQLILDVLNNYSYEKELEFKQKCQKYERAELMSLFENFINATESLMSAENAERSLANIDILDKALHLLKSNVNIELILDKLCIEAR